MDAISNAALDQRLASLAAGLRSLSPHDRELISLRFDAELSYPEIAGVMHLHQETVSLSMLKALRELRQLMAQRSRR